MESIDFGSNWVPIARYTADLLGLAYDRSTGFVNLLPQIAPLIPSIRLANKQVVPRTPEFQCPNSTCWIPRAFLNDDYCDCPGCEDGLGGRLCTSKVGRLCTSDVGRLCTLLLCDFVIVSL